MHQSIAPVPIPRATPGQLFRFSVLGVGKSQFFLILGVRHLHTPGGDPQEFDTCGFETVKGLGPSHYLCLFYFLR